MNSIATTSNGRVHASVLANGEPASLVEIVEHEAMGYRAWGTREGDFLARQMDRLSQLIRWTGAKTPEEHEDRMEVWDAEIREQWEARGFEEGMRSCQCGRCPTD